MEKCKYCQAEMDETSTICPACGQDNAEAQAASVETENADMPELEVSKPQEPEKSHAGKTALLVALCVLAVAVLVAALGLGMRKTGETEATTEATVAEITEATIPEDGNPDDVTCKGTYTVADPIVIDQKDAVIATMGDKELTNAQLQPYYWMEVQGFLSTYGSYAAYFGLDYTQPLDTQKSMESEEWTWQQYFLEAGLRNWQQLQAMADLAAEAGLSIHGENQEYLDHLEESLEETAKNNGMTLEELMNRNIGKGAGVEEFKNYQQTYLLAMEYYEQQVSAMTASEAELSKFFDENIDSFNGVTKDSKLVNIRHILLTPEGGSQDENGATTYSDEEWASCEAAAKQILDDFLNGEKNEEAFAALANEKSQDPGSNQNGGLYSGVTQGQMVENFDNWCFDTSRKNGDTGLVKTEYGYHVMYFVDSQPQWPELAQKSWTETQIRNMIANLVSEHPMDVSYEKIVLGYVDMAAE